MPSAPRPAEEVAKNVAPKLAADALSELAYQQSQSLNQRANEAFGYLGDLAAAAPPEQKVDRSVLVGAKAKAPQLASLDGRFQAHNRIGSRDRVVGGNAPAGSSADYQMRP